MKQILANGPGAKGAALVLTLVVTVLQAQNYSIPWSTLDGGGGRSTGGVYTVTGTLGQPDAGRMSGGAFTLEGGFWSVIAAIPTPGAPLLSVVRSNQYVLVHWPITDGWVLEQTNVLTGAAGPWPTVAPPYATNATDISVTVQISGGNQFFRLRYGP